MRVPVFILSFAAAACKGPATKHYRQIEKLAWLEGRWQVIAGPAPLSQLPPDTTIESWVRESDSVLVATSWSFSGKDSSINERMRLEEHGGRLQFMATVPGQNGGRTVVFPGSDSAGVATFINDRHDFPQRIHYSPVGTDSARAEVAGQTDRGYLRFAFGMKRLP